MQNNSIKFNEEKLQIYFNYMFKVIIYFVIGIVIFFIPIKIKGNTLTLIYHISYEIQTNIKDFLKLCILFYTVIGSIKIFLKQKGKKNIYFYLRLFSTFILINIFYGRKESIFINENTMIFIEEIILNTTTLFILNSIFIVFLLEDTILDLLELYFNRHMTEIFKLNGKSVLNILIYMFTDVFCGMFVTNKLYKLGKINQSQACNIILNFSIISYPTIIYICNNLRISKVRLIVVGALIFVIINIISSRIYPVREKSKTYYNNKKLMKKNCSNNSFNKILKKNMKLNKNKNIIKEFINNLEESILIIIDLIPNLIIFMCLGEILLNSEFIIEFLSYVLNPIFEISNFQNMKYLSTFIIESFYNLILAIDKVNIHIGENKIFLIGIIGILNVTSITTNILYINHTSIDIKNKEFVISYLMRVFIIILIYSLLLYF